MTCHSQLSPRIKSNALILVLSAIAVISGLRKDVGRDYNHYISIYNYISDPFINRTREEIGFRLLIKTLYQLGFNARGLFIVSSIFLSFSLYIFIKNVAPQEYWGFFTSLYICSGLFFSSLNLTRQYIAFSFLLISMSAFYTNRWIASVILFILGCTFHKSMMTFLIIIPIYILLKYDVKIGVMATLVISMILLCTGFNQLIYIAGQVVPSWKYYSIPNSATDRNTISIIKAITPTLLFIYAIFQKKDKYYHYLHDKDNLPILAGATAYAACSISFAGIMILTRITEFFTPLFFLTIIKIVRQEPSDTKPLLYCIIYIYYMTLCFVTIFIMNGNDVIPYHASIGL